MIPIPCSSWHRGVCSHPEASAVYGPQPSAGTCLIQCPGTWYDGPCRDTLPAAVELRVSMLPRRSGAAPSDPPKPKPFSSTLPPLIAVERATELAICKGCEHSGFDTHACEALPDHSCKRAMAHVAALALRRCPRGRF